MKFCVPVPRLQNYREALGDLTVNSGYASIMLCVPSGAGQEKVLH